MGQGLRFARIMELVDGRSSCSFRCCSLVAFANIAAGTWQSAHTVSVGNQRGVGCSGRYIAATRSGLPFPSSAPHPDEAMLPSCAAFAQCQNGGTTASLLGELLRGQAERIAISCPMVGISAAPHDCVHIITFPVVSCQDAPVCLGSATRVTAAPEGYLHARHCGQRTQ